MAALVSFCGGGVFDRFPHLRAAFLEANCSWAPWLLHRLDEHYDEYVGRYEITLGRKPSEYFVTNCYVSVEADEAPATLYVETFGNDNVVFSTDYPHPDAKFPHAVDAFLAGPLMTTVQAQDPLGQLRPPLPHPRAGPSDRPLAPPPRLRRPLSADRCSHRRP